MPSELMWTKRRTPAASAAWSSARVPWIVAASNSCAGASTLAAVLITVSMPATAR